MPQEFINIFIITNISAGITPHSDMESRVRFATPTEAVKTANAPKPAGSQRITRLSFDDYYTTWSGIATSKPAMEVKNPCKY